MRKAGLIAAVFFGVIIIGIAVWFFNQEVDEGYVFAEADSSVWVVELASDDVDDKSQAEIIELIQEKADNSRGTVYDVPWMNRVAGTEFEKGDQVKIYWRGGMVFQSAPAQIKDTTLLIKVDE